MAKVYIEFTVYAIRDSEGWEFFDIAIESGDTIELSNEFGEGPLDSQGVQQYFEADAYHLEAWAERMGFDYFEKKCKMPVFLDFGSE